MRLPETSFMPARLRFAVLAVLSVFAQCAWAQQKPEPKSDELDVTMQVIVDPDAKLPDEVVRKIPLPARKTESAAPAAAKQPTSSDAAAKEKERAQEARESGREASERAKERAKEAAEQRERARQAAAEERRRNPDPPGRPEPPGRPPGR
jgi:hypothetical protein